MNIYELSDEIRSLEAFYHEASDDDKDKILEIQTKNKDELREKIIEYGKFKKHIEYEIDIIKKEEKRLKERREQKEKFVGSLKNTILMALLAYGDNVRTDIIDISKRKQPDKLEILNEDNVPLDYHIPTLEFKSGVLTALDLMDFESRYGDQFKISYKISKTAINDWYKLTGEIINGTKLVQDRYSIIIK